ncbi:MAG: TlpA family protein disulfide reductase [Bacteroidetes bacterium]|nr:MAG: TlpA family protein disulfide reductase [Bacteroidota bacterium]
MMKYITVMAVLYLMLQVKPAESQEITRIDREGITMITSRTADTTYVVNFWATWCSPCVKEIGYFEDLHRETSSAPVRVYLVSLDFPNQVERRVIPFLKEKEITAPVFLVTDLQYNEWIDRVDPGWSGAIPATLIYNGEKRIFLEKEISREELFEKVNQIRN